MPDIDGATVYASRGRLETAREAIQAFLAIQPAVPALIDGPLQDALGAALGAECSVFVQDRFGQDIEHFSRVSRTAIVSRARQGTPVTQKEWAYHYGTGKDMVQQDFAIVYFNALAEHMLDRLPEVGFFEVAKIFSATLKNVQGEELGFVLPQFSALAATRYPFLASQEERPMMPTLDIKWKQVLQHALLHAFAEDGEVGTARLAEIKQALGQPLYLFAASVEPSLGERLRRRADEHRTNEVKLEFASLMFRTLDAEKPRPFSRPRPDGHG